MESINENSNEFYRKKYLKYKQKYIDTLQLYNKELDGGWFGDEFFVFVPFDIYKLVRDIYSIPIDDKPTIIDNIKGFFILLGDKSYKNFLYSNYLRKCWDNSIVKDFSWIDSIDENKSYIGLGYYSDKDGKNKKKSITEAKLQATNAIFGKSPIPTTTQISRYRFFVIESVKQGGYSISFPLLVEQIKENPVIVEDDVVQISLNN
jgi:hypothetical protein